MLQTSLVMVTPGICIAMCSANYNAACMKNTVFMSNVSIFLL